MKKIGLLSFLILCLVIGGVYATWDYAHGDAGKQVSNISVNLKASNVKTSKGNITGDGVSTLNIYLDDADHDHKADAASGEGQLKLNFVPSDLADAEVKSNGIIFQYSLSTNWELSTFKYNGVQVFSAIDTSPHELNGGKPALTVTITGAELAALITVNPLFELKTVNDYNAFVSLLSEKGFVLTISEKVA